ncbi:MAG: hypothetical protein HXY23_06645 [Parvularculaceae bacterium]|nr:hypothetical protein [Parvularculaceae bacterium]
MKQFQTLLAAVAAATVLATGAALASGGFDEVSLSGAKKLSEFKVVHVAPVQLALGNGGDYRRGGDSARPVDDTVAQIKAVDFQREMLEALYKGKGLSKTPGPGILTISATITKMEPNGRTEEEYKRSPSLSPMSSARVDGDGAAVRIEFSEDGVVIGVVSDDFNRNNRNRPSDKVWDEVDEAFETWAAALADLISAN